ncbi:inositol polyphosphate-5-phosphatase A isoform X1 [Cylas formicarius]|uniref:inositol polyphosphate-5-phosphatase A isoform X1 n=1 Tax=Cylas formicarius TaxID=197179 RepID=UPI002958CA06|nr:inositol polyphosphate-5-phosphatase A isoform X1 [Cylas formicarius]
MELKSIPVLLITANVGSLFEDPKAMLDVWVAELLATVGRLDVKFVALHCQEIGGKDYRENMKYVSDFIKLLLASEELRPFDRARIFVDEEFDVPQNFTSLASFYFVHESLASASLFDFDADAFTPVTGRHVHTGDIELVPTKEKAKFPRHFFPEGKWSRKGFMRTRWSLDGTSVDLVNLHLFHDASNLVAMETRPSAYARNRERALRYVVERFRSDSYEATPCFLFGDFNFRVDTRGVVRELEQESTTTLRLQNNKKVDSTRLQVVKDDGDVALTVGKKQFKMADEERCDWLKPYDLETLAFQATLTEFPVTFSPSYPFEEDVFKPKSYMPTRCPSWCDRILLGHSAKKLVDPHVDVRYDMIGQEVCMGDHKPVYAKLAIKTTTEASGDEFGAVAPEEPCTNPQTRCSRYVSFKDAEDVTKVFLESSL